MVPGLPAGEAGDNVVVFIFINLSNIIVQVSSPGGMEVINTAINDMIENTDKDDWSTVSVAVAPSTVSVSFHDGREPMECRVRFLSFLGIGQNVQQCAFIMHTAQVISTRNPSLAFYWILGHNRVFLLVGRGYLLFSLDVS